MVRLLIADERGSKVAACSTRDVMQSVTLPAVGRNCGSGALIPPVGFGLNFGLEEADLEVSATPDRPDLPA